MKLSSFLQRRARWINVPGALLMLLLQRLPAINVLALADEMAASSPAGVVLKSVVAAVAALGAVNTMAGATPLVPSQGTANSLTVSTGSPVAVFYTVTGTETPPMSWSISGAVPPGLDFSGLTSDGQVNVSTLELEGVPTSPGTYHVTLQTYEFTDTDGVASPVYNYTITVNGPPASTAPGITTQPASQSKTVGSSVTFTGAASGSPVPTFQWQKDNANIGGATSASFTINSVALGDAGTYTLVATNSNGSATSNGAVLTVTAANVAPAITTQPVSQSATSGSSVTFTGGASGTPTPTYQWQKNNANIGGATGTSFTINSVAAGDAGTYTLVATNVAGSATSNGAVLTISAAPAAPVIGTQPASQTVAAGGKATFTVTASGTPTPTYQWQKNNADISGATNASFIINGVATGDAGSYTVVVTNSVSTVTSSPALLTVATAAGVQVLNETATTGHGAVFSAGNTTGAIQWQVSTNGGTTWTNLSNDGTYGGVTTGTLTVSGAGAGLTGSQYRFVATNGGLVSTSNGATLTVVQAFFPFPSCLVADSSGNLYVGDSNADTIQKVNSAGQVSLVAGTSGTAGTADGSGAAARFNQPQGIALLANGTLIVADTANATIRSIATDGTVTTLAGAADVRGGADGSGTAATFSAPVEIARDANGVLFVADSMNDTVRQISSGTVSTFAGSAGSTGSTNANGAAARFNFPTGVAVDGSGNVFVADTTNNVIRKITSAGDVTTFAGVTGVSGFEDGSGSSALFNRPGGLALDASGNLYVADTGNSTVRLITPSGSVTTLAGTPTVAGLEDGTGANALLNQPLDVTVDPAGNVFVADTGNASLRKITPAGVVTTLSLSAAAVITPPPPTTTPTTPTTPMSSGGGGGGGGGAPSIWFLVSLPLLYLLRRRFRGAPAAG